ERRHRSPRLLLKVPTEVVMQAGRTAELPVDVRELATRVAQEEPAGHVVVGARESHEDQHDANQDVDAIGPEDHRLVGGEKTELGGQTAHQHERRESREKGGVGDHRWPSSNAWSMRKYVTWRPSGLTRTNSFGTRSRITKSTCAMNVWRVRSCRVPGMYRTFWKLTAALYGGFVSSLKLTF